MQRKNRGSVVIEMTLWIPLFLGIFYLYIISFLYYIRMAKAMDTLAQTAYGQQETMLQIRQEIKGKTKQFVYEETDEMGMKIWLCTDTNDPVENIRRWQLATDSIRK